jgi:glucose-1-phosphate adenylyltransferase
MYAYLFEGYWKDVGTIESLWEANMDLLGRKPAFNLYDKNWRIFYRNNAEPPHKIGASGRVVNSMLTEGCVVNGEVINSVLSNSVTIEEGAFVKDCVIMGNVTVKKGARVEYSIIDHDCVIEENACVGASREAGAKIAVLGAGYRVAEGETIEPGAMCEAQK